jgi:hypothetical protein
VLRRDARLRSRRNWRLVGLGLAVVLVICGGAYFWLNNSPAEPAQSADQPPAAGARSEDVQTISPTLYVAPKASAGLCTLTSPCTLSQALGKAAPTDVIGMTSGDYGKVKVRSTKAERTASQVVVTAASGADVQIAGLDIYASNLTWRGLTVRGVVYLRASAKNTVLDGLTVDGAGIFVRSDDTVVQNSVMENGTSLDGIQIGGAHRVRLEGNVVRDYNQNGTSGYHSDCIQLFDSSDITIIRNRLRNCSNAGIIFSGGAGTGITNVTVESNFIQGCVVESDACRGGSAIDVREPSTRGAIVRNNTILNGSARLGLQPDVILDRNIVGYLSDCAAPMTNSIVQDWNHGVCKDSGGLSANGNRIQQVQVVDGPSGDLHPVDSTTVRIPALGTTASAPLTIDGSAMPTDIAGAAA